MDSANKGHMDNHQKDQITPLDEECNNCGLLGKTWPTPHGQPLCVGCFEDWFNTEEKEPPKWVLACVCESIVKGFGPEAKCGCGRQYAVFQIY